MAPLLDLEYPELKDRQGKYERERQKLPITVTSLLAILFAILAVYSLRKKNEAEYQSRLANSHMMAIQAWQNPEADPIWILHTAIKAAETAPTFEAEDALRRAIQNSHERSVLRGHTDGVTQASFNSDGSRIVTASYDSTARVWDAATGQELVVLQGHTDRVTHASFNGEGSRIVTASGDSTARVWNTATGKELVVLRGHTRWVTLASFNDDGSRIVTASGDIPRASGKLLLVRYWWCCETTQAGSITPASMAMAAASSPQVLMVPHASGSLPLVKNW